MSVGTALRAARDHAFRAAGLNALARRRLDGTRAAILMYHRVLPESEASRLAIEPGMYVTPESFDQQLAALRQFDFEPTPLHTLLEAQTRSEPWPKRAVTLTFDDGWLDNHSYARPIVERHGFTATLFVVTERVGTAGAFWPDEVMRRLSALSDPEARSLVDRLLGGARSADDDDMPPSEALLAGMKAAQPQARLELLERLRSATPALPSPPERELMTWHELDEMARAGFDIESHGLSHELFTALDEAGLARELSDSLASLRSRGHGRWGLLAYPSGAVDPRVVRATREAGYLGAVTTRDAVACRTDEALALPRLGVHESVGRPRARFLAKFPGWR